MQIIIINVSVFLQKDKCCGYRSNDNDLRQDFDYSNGLEAAAIGVGGMKTRQNTIIRVPS